MRKIAYILTPVEYGGSEKVNLVFLKNVNRERYDVHPIILIRPWENDNTFVKALNDMGYASRVIPVAKRPVSEGRDYFRVLRCLSILHGILSKEKFDIVHTHGYFADIIGSVTSHLHNVPHIATCHGFISNDVRLKIYNIIDKLLLRYCAKVIAVSEEIKINLVKSGINEEKIVNIQNAVKNTLSASQLQCLREEKRKQLSIEKDEFVVGYAGRLSKEKGLCYLIRAGVLLNLRIRNFKIIIMGDGPERRALEYTVAQEGLQETVIFTGFVTDVEEWLPAMDIFVLPSLSEGTPMALLEAMSKGRPVIASRVGGVPMVVDDNITGFLVEPGNSAAIAEKIRYIKENEEIRNKMSMEVSKAVKIRFDVRDWCQRIEKEYDDILKRKCNS